MKEAETRLLKNTNLSQSFLPGQTLKEALEHVDIYKNLLGNTTYRALETAQQASNKFNDLFNINPILTGHDWECQTLYIPTSRPILAHTSPKTERQEQRQSEFKKRDESENKKIITPDDQSFDETIFLLNLLEQKGIEIPKNKEGLELLANKIHLSLKPEKLSEKAKQSSSSRGSRQTTLFINRVRTAIIEQNPRKKITYYDIEKEIKNNYKAYKNEDILEVRILENCFEVQNSSYVTTPIKWTSLPSIISKIKKKFDDKN